MNDVDSRRILKVPEPEINVQDPWSDDVLHRAEFAKALTNLVRGENASLIVSLHGHWGTGKTFFLKRWQKELLNKRFHSVYINAWNDDFGDDPLASIIGQLSDQVSDGKFKCTITQIRKHAGRFISGVVAVVKGTTGMDFGGIISPNVLGKYERLIKNRNDLRKQLEKLANHVNEDSKHPLVFIIDELDRCRPTFAIELLERVKHILEIPGLVFVFGINRGELCKSIQSVYGEIDADVYLRRFFDLPFTLPETDSEAFCRYLVNRYLLEKFFVDHSLDSKWFREFFPILCGCFDFSLRDIEHCIRTIAIVRASIEEGEPLRAVLLSLLVTLRLHDQSLYHAFVRGDKKGHEVMNLIDDFVASVDLNDIQERNLNELEAFIYLTDRKFQNEDSGDSMSVSVFELRRYFESQQRGALGPSLNNISNRTGNPPDDERIEIVLQLVNHYSDKSVSRSTIQQISGLIELYQPYVRE